MQKRLLNAITLSTILASSSLLASDISINSIGANIGKSHTSYEQNNKAGTIILGNTPDKYFNSLELYMTLNPILEICKKYDIRPYLSLSHSRNSDLAHNYMLAGFNKYYKPTSSELELYAGVVGGYGQMNWRYDPLNNSTKKDADANSFIAGVQAGVSYPVAKRVSLGVNTKYLAHNYGTDLKTTNATATIEQSSTIFVGLGLEWKFGSKDMKKPQETPLNLEREPEGEASKEIEEAPVVQEPTIVEAKQLYGVLKAYGVRGVDSPSKSAKTLQLHAGKLPLRLEYCIEKWCKLADEGVYIEKKHLDTFEK